MTGYSGAVSGNTVNISGGNVVDTVYGEYSSQESDATATGNTVKIDGGTFDSFSIVVGGSIGGSSGMGQGDAFSDNTLHLNSSTVMRGVRSFENVF